MTDVTVTITSATVIESRNGPDTVILQTRKPGAAYPFEDSLQLKFTAAKGTGAAYVRNHLKLNPEVIGAEARV